MGFAVNHVSQEIGAIKLASDELLKRMPKEQAITLVQGILHLMEESLNVPVIPAAKARMEKVLEDLKLSYSSTALCEHHAAGIDSPDEISCAIDTGRTSSLDGENLSGISLHRSSDTLRLKGAVSLAALFCFCVSLIPWGRAGMRREWGPERFARPEMSECARGNRTV